MTEPTSPRETAQAQAPEGGRVKEKDPHRKSNDTPSAMSTAIAPSAPSSSSSSSAAGRGQEQEKNHSTLLVAGLLGGFLQAGTICYAVLRCATLCYAVLRCVTLVFLIYMRRLIILSEMYRIGVLRTALHSTLPRPALPCITLRYLALPCVALHDLLCCVSCVELSCTRPSVCMHARMLCWLHIAPHLPHAPLLSRITYHSSRITHGTHVVQAYSTRGTGRYTCLSKKNVRFSTD